MDNEPEVIRHQMEETRTALSEKIELLEKQVVETVQDATSAVADTVENVKEAVSETVDTVKETLDVLLQVERHPWALFGGSIVLGFLGGRLLNPAVPNRGRVPETEQGPSHDSNHAGGRHNGVARRRRHAGQALAGSPRTAAESVGFGSLGDLFGEEIAKLKGIAVGMAAGVVRDLLTRSLPEQVHQRVTEVVDDVTKKLGGEPVRGPLLKDHEDSCSDPMGALDRGRLATN
jgi:hypothetical protein